MKKLFAASLTMVTTLSSAGMCETLHSISTSIMTARQNSTAMTEVMKLTNGIEAVEQLVIIAYQQPRYSVEENRQNAISEFANDVYVACLVEEQESEQ